jgi:uncharacterized protein YndB with AHSA1/START domain
LARYAATRELLAPVEDVWAFIADPHNLAKWWPGVAGVEPDRRGLAPGGRWRVVGPNKPSLLRKPELTGTLLVLAVEPPRRFAFQLTGEHLDVDLRLEETAPDRTAATLTVSGPWLIGLGRSFPRTALARLHALCQTAADL